MPFNEFVATFGETGLFAGLALFIIWFLVKQSERNDKKLEVRDQLLRDQADSFRQALRDQQKEFTESLHQRDTRYGEALNSLTSRFVETINRQTDEFARYREEIVSLRLAVAKNHKEG